MTKEISFMTGFTEEAVVIMMDRFENNYKMIKYNKISHEIAIVHWAKYNVNRLGGKPVIDCITAELSRVEDRSLLEVILPDIRKEDIRNLYIKAINEGKGNKDFKYEEYDEYDEYEYAAKKGKIDKKYKNDIGNRKDNNEKIGDDELYEKPSEEQLRRARQLYN